MSRLPGAYISHSTLARVRFRVPTKRGDSAWFEKVKNELGAAKGIAGVEINPKTGSILVFHGTNDERVAEAAEKSGLFHVSEATVRHDPKQHFVGLGPDLRRLVPPVLIVIALLQALRGNLFSPASALLLTALNMMLATQRGSFTGEDEFGEPDTAETT